MDASAIATFFICLSYRTIHRQSYMVDLLLRYTLQILHWVVDMRSGMGTQ
jgi:hypothetical protein